MAKITPRRKVALDNPAEVLTLAQRLGERLKPYATWLLVAGAAVVVALGAWGINARMQAGREAKAAEALQEVTPKVDLKVPAAETVPSLEKFIQEHPGTKAAREAQLLRANLLYRSQQYTQAAQAYEALLPGPDPGWAILVKESLSYCYEGMGDFQKAAATLKSVVDQVSGPWKSELTRRLAMLYDQAQEPREAAVYWRKLLDQPPNPALVPYIQERLAAAERRGKQAR
jgi:tetratricopeptide (TPR) repeat protein